MEVHPFTLIDEDVDHQEFDMTLQDVDTESVEISSSAEEHEQPNGHVERSGNQSNRRLQLQWSERVSQMVYREVRVASALMHNLGRRIGSVPMEAFSIPRLVRQQRWSPLNVPLLWDAAHNAASSMDHGNCITHCPADRIP